MRDRKRLCRWLMSCSVIALLAGCGGGSSTNPQTAEQQIVASNTNFRSRVQTLLRNAAQEMGVQVSPENFACGVFTNGSDGRMSVMINAAIADAQDLTLDDLRAGADVMFCYVRTDDGYRNFLIVRIRQVNNLWVAEVRNLAGETMTLDVEVKTGQPVSNKMTTVWYPKGTVCVDRHWLGWVIVACPIRVDESFPTVPYRATSGGWEAQLDSACEQLMSSVRGAMQSRSGSSFRGVVAISRDDVLSVCQLSGMASEMQLNDSSRPLGYCYIWKERNGDDLPTRIFPIKLISAPNNSYAVDGAPAIGVTLEPSNLTIKTKSSPRPRIDDNRIALLLPVQDQVVSLEVPLTQ
jgi:hypothetical protein